MREHDEDLYHLLSLSNSCTNELTNYTEMIHYTSLALLQYAFPMNYLRNDTTRPLQTAQT